MVNNQPDEKVKIDGGRIDWYNPIQDKVSVNGVILPVEEFKQFLFEKGYEGTLFRICELEQKCNNAIRKVFETMKKEGFEKDA